MPGGRGFSRFPRTSARFLCPFNSIVIPSRYLANLIACNGKLCVVSVGRAVARTVWLGCHLLLSLSRWEADDGIGCEGNGSFSVEIEVLRWTSERWALSSGFLEVISFPEMWMALCYYHQQWFLNSASEHIWPTWNSYSIPISVIFQKHFRKEFEFRHFLVALYNAGNGAFYRLHSDGFCFSYLIYQSSFD